MRRFLAALCLILRCLAQSSSANSTIEPLRAIGLNRYADLVPDIDAQVPPELNDGVVAHRLTVLVPTDAAFNNETEVTPFDLANRLIYLTLNASLSYIEANAPSSPNYTFIRSTLNRSPYAELPASAG